MLLYSKFVIELGIIINLSIISAFKIAFKKIGTQCLMQNDVYLIQTARSVIECAKYCNNNSFGPCTRFIYNKVENKCLLHSDSVIPGVTFTSVTMESGLDLYGVDHDDCSTAGYDYIPHIDSCLKHYYNVLTTWHEANQMCQNDGGKLFSITTLDKWLFLENYLSCTTKFWAGLKGSYWLNGQLFSNVFGVTLLWNNLKDSQFPNDPEYDCGIFTFNTSPEIVDVSCNMNKKRYFVCEISLP